MEGRLRVRIREALRVHVASEKTWGAAIITAIEARLLHQGPDAALLPVGRAAATAVPAASALWWAASPVADSVRLWLSAASPHGAAHVPPWCGEWRCSHRWGRGGVSPPDHQYQYTVGQLLGHDCAVAHRYWHSAGGEGGPSIGNICYASWRHQGCSAHLAQMLPPSRTS